MKKIALLTVVAALAAIVSSCCSLRTPAKGSNSKANYYYTFFGISLESAVYGDGLIVNAMNNNE